MHLAIAGEDYPGAIDTFYPRICNVLVQCVCPAREGETPFIIHAGKEYVKARIDENTFQDWPVVFGKLKRLGYDGWITVIENTWPQDQRKKVAIKWASYLNDLWRSL